MGYAGSMHSSTIPSDPAELAESPITAALLRKQVAAWPQAAAVTLDLLHSIDLEDPAHGLIHESLAYGMLQGGNDHVTWLSRPRDVLGSEPGRVRVSRTGNVLQIILDRPMARNAIDCAMRDALHDAFTVAMLDPDVLTVRMLGAGRAFCVGADLDEFGTTRDPATAHCIRMQTLPALAIIRCAHKFEAHVQGACIGSGLEMAAFAHRVTATRDAWFQLPELAMGLIPGAGGCVSVARRIGRRRAALMILSGKRINAKTALNWGLIDAIVNDPAVNHRHADIVC